MKKFHFTRGFVLVTNLVRRTDEKVSTELLAITGGRPMELMIDRPQEN